MITSIDVRKFLRLDSHEVVLECRHCGTSVDDESGPCPECGTQDIVRYDI